MSHLVPVWTPSYRTGIWVGLFPGVRPAVGATPAAIILSRAMYAMEERKFFMKLPHFFCCFLAAGSLLALPELGLARGGGGGGGHGFGRSAGSFSAHGLSPRFGEAHRISGQRYSRPPGRGYFDDHGFRGRGRDLRQIDGDFFDFGFYGFGYPDYPYYYAAPY